MGILEGTSEDRGSWWARAGAIGFVVVAVFGVVDHFVAPAGAQVEPSTEAVSVTAAGEPLGLPSLNTSPAISDDANIVAFVNAADDGVETVAVRNREANTTSFVAESASSHPAVSADGCAIAYLVEVAADPDDASSVPNVELRAADRCASPDGPLGAGVLVDTLPIPDAVGSPAVSADGSLIVWSTGTTIERYVRFVNSEGVVIYVVDDTFDPLADGASLLPPDVVTGGDVAVSADAGVVAFVAGPGVDPYAASPTDVYVWSDDPADENPPVVELASIPASTDPEDATAPPEAGSSGPVLSGDGALVLFESSDTDLAANAGTVDAVTPFIVMYQRGVGSGVLEYGAKRPAISSDGHHAVYEGPGGSIWELHWTSGDPLGSISAVEIVGSSEAETTEPVGGPVISAHGRSIVFESDDGAALTDDERFHTGTHVWLRLQPEELSSEDVDLGSIDFPGVLTGKATVTNQGVPGFPIESVTVDAPFSLVATDCAGVLHPGLSCSVDVSADITAAGTFDGLIRISGGTPTTEFAVALTAIGTDPAATSTTTSTTTTSTSPPMTSPPTTRPPTTRPPTTRPPTTSPPITRPPTTSPPATTTTTTLTLPVVFNPPSFEFAPTIVDAGRRTASVDMFNPAQQAATLVALQLDPATGSGFVLDGAACLAQPLQTGDSCTVGLEFAPTTEGALSATIIADFADGVRTTMMVTGIGAPPPTLTVTPDVASNGQVVAVEGAGFPAGGTVQLFWDAGRVLKTSTIDSIGGFVETMVVPSNTPSGRSAVVVLGQVDVFGDVTAQLLVSAAGNRSEVPVFGGLGPSLVR